MSPVGLSNIRNSTNYAPKSPRSLSGSNQLDGQPTFLAWPQWKVQPTPNQPGWCPPGKWAIHPARMGQAPIRCGWLDDEHPTIHTGWVLWLGRTGNYLQMNRLKFNTTKKWGTLNHPPPHHHHELIGGMPEKKTRLSAPQAMWFTSSSSRLCSV